MVKHSGRKIIHTFKYGTCFSMWSKIIYLILAVILLFMGITQLIVEYFENIVFTCFCCVVGGICLAVTVYYFCKVRRIDKDISKWLKDEHLFETYAETYEFEEWFNRGYVSYKLGIKFENKCEKYSQYTSHFESAWRFKKICKLAKSNRLEILYSPKYGEVMILDSDDNVVN